MRGRLKIFLGYASGVGKTYAMVEAARQRKAEGVNVLVGCIETHEQADLLNGLHLLEPGMVSYAAELNVDAVLHRHPQLVLIDDLAHRNPPGSRHPQRYQDVEELLDSGINVYTTLNIQNLESLNDVVAQITGTIVSETIPDRVFDEATELELIDLPPDELLQRLQEGPALLGERAGKDPFFRKGNLTALRELALRRMAQRVDRQMRDYMQDHAILEPWPASDHLLVCIGVSAADERLVRTAWRLAEALRADWTVLHVKSQKQRQRPETQQQLLQTLKLAESLGAKTTVISSHSIAETIVDYARRYNVTQIVIGGGRYPHWLFSFKRSLESRIYQLDSRFDIHTVSVAKDPPTVPSSPSWEGQSVGRRYLQSLALVVLASLLSALAHFFIRSPANLGMIYLLIVVIAAVYLGRGPAIFASFVGVLAFDYLFVPPYFTLAVSQSEYLLTFLGQFIVGVVISGLTARARERAEIAQAREAETAALYALSRDLVTPGDLETILVVVVRHVRQTIGQETYVILPDPKQGGALQIYPACEAWETDPKERGAAEWAFIHQRPAGRDTYTHPDVQMHYLPLYTAGGRVGVLAVRWFEPSYYFPKEKYRLLETFAGLTALAIERLLLNEAARQAKLLQDTEKLQSALLNSISHDLRTPLASVTGALSSLDEDESLLDETARRNLIETARKEAERLNQLVGNLLDMTRLEAGTLKIRRELYDVQEVIGITLEHLGVRVKDRPIVIDAPAGLPMVPVDGVLIAHALGNVIDNALKYSPADLPVEITAQAQAEWLEIRVTDHGLGIPVEDLGRIFEKFYRVSRSEHIAGTGLGLSISKGIVEAHGGRITAYSGEVGGTVMAISLPLSVSDDPS